MNTDLRNLCKRFVLDIERAHKRGELWDYLNDNTLDANVVLSVGGGDKVLIGVEIDFMLNGPTVWLNTREHAVFATTFGGNSVNYPIDPDICDEINEMYAEQFGFDY